MNSEDKSRTIILIAFFAMISFGFLAAAVESVAKSRSCPCQAEEPTP